MPYSRLAPPTSIPDLLRASASVTSSHDDWLSGPAVEQFDVAGGMRQQQLDGLGLGRVGGVVDEPPEAGLPQAGRLVVAGLGQPPGPRLPVQVVAAVVGHHDLLAEPVVAAGSAALALAAPHAHQRQQREQRIVEVGALAQVGGVGGQRQVVEHRDVAGGRRLGPFGRGGDRPVARTPVVGASSEVTIRR